MLELLLDENLSQVIAHAITAQRPDIRVFSANDWEKGRLRGAGDETLLRIASGEGFTLVTYDVNSIPLLLIRLANEDFTHAGIVFVHNASIRSDEFGGLVRSLIALYDTEKDADWQNRLFFLPARAGS